MVKGISKQVIVVQSPERKLFEQAIFILRDDMGEGVTEDALLKEAERAVRLPQMKRSWIPALWAAVGAAATGAVWLITVFL